MFRPWILTKLNRMKNVPAGDPLLSPECVHQYQLYANDPSQEATLDQVRQSYTRWQHNIAWFDREPEGGTGWPGDPSFRSKRGETNEPFTKRMISLDLAARAEFPDLIISQYAFCSTNGQFNWMKRPYPRTQDVGEKNLWNRMKWAMTKLDMEVPGSEGKATQPVALLDTIDYVAPVFYVRGDGMENTMAACIHAYAQEFHCCVREKYPHMVLVPLINPLRDWSKEPYDAQRFYEMLRECTSNPLIDGVTVNLGPCEYGPEHDQWRARLRRIVFETAGRGTYSDRVNLLLARRDHGMLPQWQEVNFPEPPEEEPGQTEDVDDGK